MILHYPQKVGKSSAFVACCRVSLLLLHLFFFNDDSGYNRFGYNRTLYVCLVLFAVREDYKESRKERGICVRSTRKWKHLAGKSTADRLFQRQTIPGGSNEKIYRTLWFYFRIGYFHPFATLFQEISLYEHNPWVVASKSLRVLDATYPLCALWVVLYTRLITRQGSWTSVCSHE